LYAEDPAHQFLPATGTVRVLVTPSGPGVRFDGGIAAGTVIGIDYDPLLARISTWGATREEARARMLTALDETMLLGVVTNRDYLRAVLAHPAFAGGATHTEFLGEHLPAWQPSAGPHRDLAALAAALAFAGAPDTSGAASGADARPPSPWEMLGAWRPGGTR
jgi:acetyl/propionyl-CoA carboxylase alpha subunit